MCYVNNNFGTCAIFLLIWAILSLCGHYFLHLVNFLLNFIILQKKKIRVFFLVIIFLQIWQHPNSQILILHLCFVFYEKCIYLDCLSKMQQSPTNSVHSAIFLPERFDRVITGIIHCAKNAPLRLCCNQKHIVTTSRIKIFTVSFR